MASIRCASCKGTHQSVYAVKVCHEIEARLVAAGMDPNLPDLTGHVHAGCPLDCEGDETDGAWATWKHYCSGCGEYDTPDRDWFHRSCWAI